MSQHEHNFANPTPAGLIGLSVACFTLFALLTGRVPHEVLPILATWQFGAFVAQIITAVIELRDKNIAGGNVFTYFASFFCFTGGLESLTKYYLSTNGLPFSAAVDGYAWLVLAIATTLLTPAFLAGSSVLFAGLITADIAIWAVALMDLKVIAPTIGAPTAGWFLLFLGIIGLYLAGGTVLNTVFKKTILPLGKPIIKVD